MGIEAIQVQGIAGAFARAAKSCFAQAADLTQGVGDLFRLR